MRRRSRRGGCLVVQVPRHAIASLRHDHARQAIVCNRRDCANGVSRGREAAGPVIVEGRYTVMRCIDDHVAAGAAADREAGLRHRVGGAVVRQLLVVRAAALGCYKGS